MLFLMNSFILLSLSLMLFLNSLIMYLNNNSMIMEWTMFNFNSMDISIFILIDWMSLLFSSLVMFISSMIYLYCFSYMNLEKFKNRFNYILMLFILSMNMMIYSPNLISIMIGWDGLGIISFCLVIYYQNFLSFKGGLLTIMCNRFGDIGILMSISLMMIYGSWNFNYYNNMIFLLLMIAAISKSAQMPFSLWLPAAMAAPTPISSLVHSSTLVTAGIYLLIRYSMMLNINKNLIQILFFISFITLIMSSIMALLEYDFKKIIALSTLNQLSLMMMNLSIGFWKITFFHLISHALFKSLLFLCAGLIIHSMNNMQDIRMYGGLFKMYPLTMNMFFISSLSLSGFPFLSGFYSKDLIIENMIISNNLIWIMLIFSSILTLSYSLRLFYFLFFNEMNYLSININNENKIMFFSMNMLFFLSIMMGSMLYWMYFFNTNLSYPNFMIKNLIISMILFGFLIFTLYHLFKIYKKINLFFMKLMYNMMNFNKFFNNMYMPYLNFSKKYYKILEKGWFEIFFNKYLIYFFIKKIMIFKFNFKKMLILIMLNISIFFIYMMLIILFK